MANILDEKRDSPRMVRARVFSRVAGCCAILLAVAELIVQARARWIDLPALARILSAFEPEPANMRIPTAASLLLGGAAVVFLAGPARMRSAVRWLAIAMVLFAISSIAGWPFAGAADGRMGIATASAIAIEGIALHILAAVRTSGARAH